MYQKHMTRSTKRGPSTMSPPDQNRTEAETSLSELAEAPTKDGRNPHIATGSAMPPKAQMERP